MPMSPKPAKFHGLPVTFPKVLDVLNDAISEFQEGYSPLWKWKTKGRMMGSILRIMTIYLVEAVKRRALMRTIKLLVTYLATIMYYLGLLIHSRL